MSRNIIIKVCGMRESQNIKDVERLDIDMMGFIFWSGSKRLVNEKPSYMPERVKRTGVFVNESIENICTKVSEYHLDAIQLHGNESPAMIIDLKRAMPKTIIIKALSIGEEKDLEETEGYHGIADLFLFDTKSKAIGGSGIKFDWTILEQYKGPTEFILSGGIDSDDANKVFSLKNPYLCGIDLNSRFECAPALKDVNKLDKFIKQIRNEQNKQTI